MVGLFANPMRASHEVAAFLVGRGYDCVGVNPGLAGQTVARLPVVASFRASEFVGAVVDEALALPAPPRVIWMQLGVIDHAAKARAEAAGLAVVMNACPRLVLASV